MGKYRKVCFFRTQTVSEFSHTDLHSMLYFIIAVTTHQVSTRHY